MSHLSDESLDRLTAHSSIFIDRRWLRLLDTVDLPLLLKGEARLRYVVVQDGERLLGVCPFIETHSPSIFFHYSLEKFFFVSWQEELLRMSSPGLRRWVHLLARGTQLYCSFARLMRSGVEGWVLAVSPLSYRGSMAILGDSLEERREVSGLILKTLQEVAVEREQPLCLYGLEEEETELRRQLLERGFKELFLFFDNRLDIDFKSFDEYLGHFRSKTRSDLKKEYQQASRLGFRFERIQDFEWLGSDFERLYETTYSKYGEEHFHHPATFWTQLHQQLGPQAEAIVAFKDSQALGFVMQLLKGDTLWLYRVGREPGGEHPLPIYFNLAFYEPIQRALDLGIKRLWLGPGAWNTKQHRGARGQAIYSYIWFPHRRARELLGPYLSLFTHVSRAQQEKLVAD